MEEELQDQASEMPDLQQVLGVVRRRHWHFLLPFFAGWLLIWALSWYLPSVYRSATLILVEKPAVPEKIVGSNINLDISQQLDSITQQILSRTRLLQIIDHLNLYAKDRKSKTPDELVETMRKDIEIELVRGDDKKLSSFNIYYANRDPKMAQAATSELASLFITENNEQRQARSENTTNFLEDQLAVARKSLAEQEERVRQFKDRHLGELPSQTQSNLQILTGMQNQLQSQEDALNRAKQQNAYLESLISQSRTLDRSSKSSGGPVGLAAIDQELDRLRGQLADLSSHYTDKHPDVRKTKEQIARTEKMRERIIADMNKPGAAASDPSATSSLDPKSAPLLDLESQLKANRVEIADVETHVAGAVHVNAIAPGGDIEWHRRVRIAQHGALVVAYADSAAAINRIEDLQVHAQAVDSLARLQRQLQQAAPSGRLKADGRHLDGQTRARGQRGKFVGPGRLRPKMLGRKLLRLPHSQPPDSRRDRVELITALQLFRRKLVPLWRGYGGIGAVWMKLRQRLARENSCVGPGRASQTEQDCQKREANPSFHDRRERFAHDPGYRTQ